MTGSQARRPDRRRTGAENTRARIIAAARGLLMDGGGFAGFTVDAIATRAGVARMTIYYQYGSKIGLLEALCDTLAAAGGMEQLATAFRRPDPLDGLARYIDVFSHFWNSDRVLTRRLHGLAALDPEFSQVLKARESRRREGLQVLVRRIAQQYGRPGDEGLDDVVDVLYTLISFESFDSLASDNRSMEDVAPIVRRVARAVIGLAD